MTDVSQDNIARRARELWEIAGRPEGRDDEFWYKAEQQVSGEAETREQLQADSTTSKNSL
jgi:hypothetical protein